MFHWLNGLKYSEISVFKDKNDMLIAVSKQPDEIIILDFDYKAVEKKFYDWVFSEEETFYLNEQDTLLFLECCRTGYFYLNKQHYNIGVIRNNIIKLYDFLFNELGFK